MRQNAEERRQVAARQAKIAAGDRADEDALLLELIRSAWIVPAAQFETYDGRRNDSDGPTR
jgi:hypothetical protein